MDYEKVYQKYENGSLPIPVVDIASDLGIDVYETDSFKDNESGSITKENDKYVIYVNENHPATRKRFTIAHEIGHFVHHREKLDTVEEMVSNVKQPSMARQNEVPYADDEKKQEREANQFAAELLMPKERFLKDWEKTDSIEELAKKYKVSVSAAAIRVDRLTQEFIS